MEQEGNKRASLLKLSSYSKSTIITVLAVVIVGFGLLIILGRYWQSKQKIDKIRISGTTYLFQNELLSIITPYISSSSDSLVILKEIEVALERNPYIYNAVATFEKNHILNVEIKERDLIGLYRNKDGSFSYIDATGKIIPHRAIAKFSDLPVVTSKAKSPRSDKRVAIFAAKILKALSDEKYNDFSHKISELIYDNKDGTYYMLSNEPDCKINLGRSDDIKQKLDKLQVFLNSEVNASLNSGEEYILDLRWHNRVLISKKI